MASVGIAGSVQHGAGQEPKDTGEHSMAMPETVSWVEGPASLPKGASFVVLEGDPTQAGPFTMRLKLPAGFRIPPHFHPADERITVIQGTFYMGLGESWDDAKLQKVPTGGFAMMKAGTRHFARAGNTEVIVQLHGMGPWGITYVNPADDPRRKTK